MTGGEIEIATKAVKEASALAEHGLSSANLILVMGFIAWQWWKNKNEDPDNAKGKTRIAIANIEQRQGEVLKTMASNRDKLEMLERDVSELKSEKRYSGEAVERLSDVVKDQTENLTRQLDVILKQVERVK